MSRGGWHLASSTLLKEFIMIYIYDKKTLTFKNVVKRASILVILGVCFLIGSAFVSFNIVGSTNNQNIKTHISQDTVVLKEFTREDFIIFMKEVNIKYPHIVYAQSLIETGGFKSTIFKDNHNLFGMKQARVRCNIAQDTKRGHAYYNHWTESVIDYALYQTSYMYKIKSEDQYFAHLSKSYAEDPNYVSKLKAIIVTNNLEEFVDSI